MGAAASVVGGFLAMSEMDEKKAARPVEPAKHSAIVDAGVEEVKDAALAAVEGSDAKDPSVPVAPKENAELKEEVWKPLKKGKLGDVELDGMNVYYYYGNENKIRLKDHDEIFDVQIEPYTLEEIARMNEAGKKLREKMRDYFAGGDINFYQAMPYKYRLDIAYNFNENGKIDPRELSLRLDVLPDGYRVFDTNRRGRDVNTTGINDLEQLGPYVEQLIAEGKARGDGQPPDLLGESDGQPTSAD